MTQGKQNKSIAQDLGVSPRTVEIHRARVMEKMNAQSVAQLVRMMLDLQHATAAEEMGTFLISLASGDRTVHHIAHTSDGVAYRIRPIRPDDRSARTGIHRRV